MPAGAAITKISVFPLRQPQDGSEAVVIEIQTEAGMSGWGEAPAHPDLVSAVRAIEMCQDHLRGRDATAAASIAKSLDDLRHQEKGRELTRVKGAIDMALMDILGKLSRAPVYELFGGPTRNKARALASLRGTTEQQLFESLQRSIQAGFRCVSVPLVLPTGAREGRGAYQPVRRLLERMREASKVEMDLVLDCGGRLSAAEATRLAQELETFHLLWLDEPCREFSHGVLAGVSAETVTPIGLGRDVENKAEFQDLLRAEAIDVLRPDIRRWGITELRKAAALAETYYVALAPRNSGGPIATAAALHLAASIPNFFLLEFPLPFAEEDLKVRSELSGADLETVQDGFVPLPRGPGLGVTVDRAALDRYRVKI
jgi:galactonate dehydratase